MCLGEVAVLIKDAESPLGQSPNGNVIPISISQASTMYLEVIELYTHYLVSFITNYSTTVCIYV